MNEQNGSNEVVNSQPEALNANNQNGSKKNDIILVSVIGGVVALIAIVILLFTMLGGKTKTLTCTNKETSLGMEMNMEAKMNFKNDKIQDINALITVDLGSYASYKDTFIEQFENQYASYKDENVDVDITSDDSKVYIRLKADRDNYKNAGVAKSDSYEAAKKELEAQGFTCK